MNLNPHPWTPQDQFRDSLRALAHEVNRYGVERFAPDPTSRIDMIRFRQLVHEGWRLAQKRAVAMLRELADETGVVKQKIKNAHKRRDRVRANELTNIAHLLKFRQRQVQYGVNAIAWTIFGNQPHIARRFVLDGAGNNLSVSALVPALTYADRVNQDPNRFAIVCDLTTFLHVGDVVAVSYDDDGPLFEIVELKSGKTNDKCRQLLDQTFATGCLRRFALGVRDMDQGELKQVDRMLKQDIRGMQTVEVLMTDSGTDIDSGKPIAIRSDHFVIDSFDAELCSMADEIRSGQSWALDTIDDCLHVGLYTDAQIGRAGFAAWVGDADGPSVDYRMVFSTDVAQPTLCALPDHDFQVRLYTGEWTLLMCLDVHEWLRRINSRHPGGATLLERRETARLQSQGVRDLFVHKGRAIRFVTPKGEVYVSDGILVKILFSFYRPVDAVRPFFAPETPA